MAEALRSTDHEARAVRRLLGQFRFSPKFTGIVATYAGRLQKLEDVAWQVLDAWTSAVTSAPAGDMLTKMGKIVGRGRGSLADPEYWTAIRLKILVRRCGGRIEDFLRALRFAMNGNTYSVQSIEFQPATYLIEVSSAFGVDQMAIIWEDAFRRIKAAGVRLVFTYSTDVGTNDFTYSTIGEYSDSVLIETDVNGWGDADDPTLGGFYAGAYIT